MKRKLIDECLKIALKNNKPEKHQEWSNYHHFSFVIQDDNIVSVGKNRCSSPLLYLGYQLHTKMHSEVDAYFKAKGILSKKNRFEVINIRLTKTNIIRHSEPCKCCFAFLKNLGCYRVWFTTNIGNFACLTF
jgi:tRNA(Arg) A34 adenosine deaminase TadA